jgi:hypothetical protein
MNKRKDFSFIRFFHPNKSVSTQVSRDGKSYDYFPKNFIAKGKVVWDSWRKGTYQRSIHGELEGSKHLLK